MVTWQQQIAGCRAVAAPDHRPNMLRPAGASGVPLTSALTVVMVSGMQAAAKDAAEDGQTLHHPLHPKVGLKPTPEAQAWQALTTAYAWPLPHWHSLPRLQGCQQPMLPDLWLPDRARLALWLTRACSVQLRQLNHCISRCTSVRAYPPQASPRHGRLCPRSPPRHPPPSLPPRPRPHQPQTTVRASPQRCGVPSATAGADAVAARACCPCHGHLRLQGSPVACLAACLHSGCTRPQAGHCQRDPTMPAV